MSEAISRSKPNGDVVKISVWTREVTLTTKYRYRIILATYNTFSFKIGPFWSKKLIGGGGAFKGELKNDNFWYRRAMRCRQQTKLFINGMQNSNNIHVETFLHSLIEGFLL